MKRIVFTTALALFASNMFAQLTVQSNGNINFAGNLHSVTFNANAQDDTRISVLAGEQPISEQLTEEQKASVTHLAVAGQLTDADYAFFSKTKLKELVELNLQDVDNDTIPAKAFFHDYNIVPWDLKPVRIFP